MASLALRQTTRQLVIASLRLRLASQTTRLLVNKTTSGASQGCAGFTELWNYGFTEGFAGAAPEIRNYGITDLRRATPEIRNYGITELRIHGRYYGIIEYIVD